jgi:glucan biosynthesis protein C
MISQKPLIWLTPIGNLEKREMNGNIPESNVNQAKTPQRLFFIDNLRTFLIILVFLDHLAITYGSPFGSWYYHEGLVGFPEAAIYATYQGFTQAFFMGLLFFLSGYLTPPSFARKGSKQFLRDRLIRLGIPIVIFTVFVSPVVNYAVASINGYSGSFLVFIQTYLPFGLGPLWFVLALLMFDGGYALWRLFFAKPWTAYSFPTKRIIVGIGLLIGVITFAVRVFFPEGWAVPLIDFQLAFFPQYIAFFIFGLIAYRSNWILSIPKGNGQYWGTVASLLTLVSLGIFLASILTGASFLGGLTWQTAAYALWEQVFAIAVSIWLVIWFREKFNTQNRFLRFLSYSSYGAYIIQTPVLVFLALSLQSIQLPLLLKFFIVSPVAVSLCFLLAYLIKKAPKADKVL